ncbi:Kelch-like protein 1 [Nymphon striatum]|nr:Kelch-like protein 1 [Nymphon striatum]
MEISNLSLDSHDEASIRMVLTRFKVMAEEIVDKPDAMLNIATRDVATADVEQSLLKAEQLGQNQLEIFVKDRMADKKPADVNTFGEYADVVVKYVLKQGEAYNRIDVTFDRYNDLSIKGDKRVKRTKKSRLIRRLIEDDDVPLPNKWTNFMASTDNKGDLCLYLSNALATAPSEKTIVVGGGFASETEVRSTDANMNTDLLESTHEEADTRVVLHCIHSNEQTIVAGTSKKPKYVPIHDIRKQLGFSDQVYETIPAFHAITSCDTVSYFSGHSKKYAWNVFIEHNDLLKDLGRSPTLSTDVSDDAEKFICHIYKTSSKNCDQARVKLFSKCNASDSMPPSSDAAQYHIQRANYQSLVWIEACNPKPVIPSPTESGWKLVDGVLKPVLTSLPPIPKACKDIKTTFTPPGGRNKLQLQKKVTKEKFRENPDLNNFKINGFKLENVKKIFDFFYSDSIIINKNDLNEIFRLAKLFQLNRVLDKVFTYVKDALNVENVLSIRDLWMSCDKMEEVKICDQFIEKNLNDISKLQIFKVIEFNYLKQLMKSNNLVVPDEKRIFEIVIEWLNVDIQTRQQFGQQLMEDVRFPLMPYEFLLQTSDHEIIQNAKLIKRIMESVQYSIKKEFRIGQNILTRVDITPRKYQNVFANEEELNEILICIGGLNNQMNVIKSIEMCADLGRIWNKYDEIEPGRYKFASCTYENYIILIGGQGAMQSCSKYDPKNKTFIELEPLPGRRTHHVATIINSQLFICGGAFTPKSLITLNLIERNGKWRYRKSSLENRIGSTGCLVNNKFYVFGGSESNSCEYYCPQEDTWRPLPKMKEERWCAGSCYDNNKFIYVVGGHDWRNYISLTSMERFDVEIGQWLTLKSSIGVGRCALTLTMFKNQIILIGGRDKHKKPHKTIQKYDSISDSWSQIGTLKEARANHCTVRFYDVAKFDRDWVERAGDQDGRPLLSSGPIWADDDDDEVLSSYIFEEKFRENPNLNKFEISGFKLENVNKIFDFFYSDSIIINNNDLKEIVRLAKIFQLQIFKVIEFNYLKLLMKSNNLVVPDEKRIFEIAIEWLSVDIQTRQQFGQQLMEDVRFPLMSYEFLLQIPDHELIQKKSLRRIMESVHYSDKKEFRIGQNVLKRS